MHLAVQETDGRPGLVQLTGGGLEREGLHQTVNEHRQPHRLHQVRRSHWC